MPFDTIAAVTPFVLTLDEASNIERALASLQWARRVVVVDSGSTDATLTIANKFANVEIVRRAFDSFKLQSEFAMNDALMDSEYALALDADMATPEEWVRELRESFLPGRAEGGWLSFDYRISGVSLMGSMLRPQLRLVRRSSCKVVQQGHGHKFEVSGSSYRFASSVVHDDRKSIERWVSSQLGYSRAEAGRLESAAPRSLVARLRVAGLMPLAAGIYAYGRAGGPFRGDAALRYACERVVFECLLSMRLMEARNGAAPPPKSE